MCNFRVQCADKGWRSEVDWGHFTGVIGTSAGCGVWIIQTWTCVRSIQVTSHNLRSQCDRHFVGITRHNVCSQGAKIYHVIPITLNQLV